MLRIWGRLRSTDARKVVLCAQVLVFPVDRIDAGLNHGVVNTPDHRTKNANGLVPLLECGDFRQLIRTPEVRHDPAVIANPVAATEPLFTQRDLPLF